jgi:hypothetical protein
MMKKNIYKNIRIYKKALSYSQTKKKLKICSLRFEYKYLNKFIKNNIIIYK